MGARRSSEVERALDELYAADLDEFVPGRNELAKRLRKEGDRDAADEVAGLRKPTVVAWAGNRLARVAPDYVEALLEAGDELREAQRAVLGGGQPRVLDEARRTQADAVTRLVRQARPLLASEPALDRLAETLRAASVDEGARERLRRGRLEAEVEPAGLEALASLAGPAGGRRTPSKTPDRRARLSEAREALKEARAREREAKAEARAAARAAEQAHREAERLGERAEEAAREADAASETRAEAEQRLGEARRR